MDFIWLTHTWEFAEAILLALFNVILVCLFGYAYRRSGMPLFILLLLGNISFMYANLVSASGSLYFSTHVRLFPGSVMRMLYAAQMISGPVGSVLWFIGTVLLVRVALKSGSSDAGT